MLIHVVFFLAWFAEDCAFSQTFVQLSLTPTLVDFRLFVREEQHGVI